MKILIAAFTLVIAITGCAEMKEAGRDIGHATKEVTTDIGHATRDATKSVGHASRDAAKSVKQDLSKEN
ncbi:hypothetical protein [Shewanella sp. Isolate11]|uniref:hypothetical protein n=1 Tax=Shewanella sp. Isolate11 TaxID=2908530 RepID=UPI001EFE2F2A|nr:hypothetical protein [Shewanella sp. Isolate11]MCG9696041.1 hypothetical protein [Shewanella sp. Isolate11]